MVKTVNAVRSEPKKILMVVANPSVATTTKLPVGFWASELTHPYYEFMEVGYQVEIASPKGGKVELDAFSDPRHESGYSAHDLISMGFLNTPALAGLLENTKKISEVKHQDYDAIVVCGGQSPMFTFPNEKSLHKILAEFYESEKITAALCHGVSALLKVKLSDGSNLIKGKTMTGFSNIEEDFVDNLMKQKVMPFRIEDEARKIGANFVSAGLWKEFAIRDGRLITGQQQYSGKATAKLVIEALGL
ncbi:MAG: type 1 glutamine amidotransferase domain-containing protein [Candidatus Methanoperedens sp.]|nr:type 1 glutamine amidotransferase domain-containing protein [Candidatus Methanoperedens sp.]MCZ7369350.1 type 1 glutamine amidotransferase domain-containing protein [Candidatus Methanoperedens sp.]